LKKLQYKYIVFLKKVKIVFLRKTGTICGNYRINRQSNKNHHRYCPTPRIITSLLKKFKLWRLKDAIN